eukprot:5114718-Pyramimonas_sp.AAC.2
MPNEGEGRRRRGTHQVVLLLHDFLLRDGEQNLWAVGIQSFRWLLAILSLLAIRGFPHLGRHRARFLLSVANRRCYPPKAPTLIYIGTPFRLRHLKPLLPER